MTFNYKIAFWVALFFIAGITLIGITIANNLMFQINLEKLKVSEMCILTNKAMDMSNSLMDLNNEYQVTFLEPSEQELFTTKLSSLDCESFK